MIAFSDLRAQNDPLRREIEAAIAAVVDSNEFCLGSAVGRFERSFAEICGVRHAIGVNSGTSALHLALLALDLGPGKDVITVPSTFVATVAAIRYTGARPVLVDIDPERFTMDARKLEAAVTERTAAILPVHLYGQMADMDPIRQVAERHGIPVIEDAAQAHGATYKGAAAGSTGRIGAFSFYPGKLIGAFGEAGAVVTNDDEIALRICAMRDWGQQEHAVHNYPCFNYRMDGIQGAVLEVKLRRLKEWAAARQNIALQYDHLFADKGLSNVIRLPQACPDGDHVYHQYAIRVPRRDRVRARLKARGVATGVHYPRPVHLQPGFSDLGFGPGRFPAAEALAETTLSLPIYPELGLAAQKTVADAIAAVVLEHD
jgi:dTDP-4-amino-4,6-dideoxygalactose transaminase